MTRRFSTLTKGAVVVLAAVAMAGFGFAQQSILDDPARTDDERARDAGSKPLEVYAFWGIEPGMNVLEIAPGGGYNTFILSKLVGDGGMVYAGPDRRGRFSEALAARPLDNVEVTEAACVAPAGSIDVVVTVRNLHDFGERAGEVMANCLSSLKPGGVLGVVDARTTMAGYDDNTHRLNQDRAIEIVTAAGFEFVEESDILRRDDDDYGVFMVEGRQRYHSDRMLLKFRKPEM